MEGSILAPGGAVRVRPVDGGGNETLETAPASGQFVVRGLENGNYEAVDGLGNKRVFTVTQGPGEEVVLEDFGQAEEEAGGVQLDPLHGTEAAPVADQSHEIQAGQPAMTLDGASLVRGEPDASLETAPPTVPGPNSPAAEPPVAPSAVVTEETVGNSSDAVAPTEPAAEPSVAESDPVSGDPTRHDLEPWNLSTGHLAAVLDGDTAEFASAGQIDAGAAVDELKQRAEGGDVDAQAALEKHGLVPSAEVAAANEAKVAAQPTPPAEPAGPEQTPQPQADGQPAADVLDAKSLAAVVAGADDAPAGVEPVAARDELERRAKDGDPEAEQALASLAGSEVPPADDPEHVSETPAVDPGAQA